MRFEVVAATGLPGTGYDLITFFDSLHDMGDPLGALVRARAAVSPAGAVLLFEPLGADDVQGNLNPNGRMFYAVSTLACTPNAVSQKTATSSRAAGRPGGREAAAGPGRRSRVQQRPQARHPGPDEPGVGPATLTSHDGAMSPADRLIGRESALAAASSVLGAALGGSGQFLMISGEAGIGKSAMLAALIDRAGPGPLVLRGFCWEGDGTPPYWPWSQVLRACGLSMAELGEAGWLLPPASRSVASMSAAAAADAQFRLFEAVSRSLSGLAADRPVLVVLDDLQWADEPSLRLLGFLARALSAKAVLLLGAYRDTEASPELLELAGTAQQLALAGLTPADVETMARELAEAMAELTPSSQVISQLWQRSGGNPFFIRELTRLLVAQGSWHEQTQIPASVAETLRRRLARLSTGCVRLLEWAAVAGRDIDLCLLTQAGVAGDEPAVLGLLAEARRAGVIVGTSEPRFTHDLYRETLLDGLAAAARAAVNLSVGRALKARSGPAARVAAHLLAAGAKAQQDALEYSTPRGPGGHRPPRTCRCLRALPPCTPDHRVNAARPAAQPASAPRS